MQHQTKMLLQTKQLTMLLQRQKRQQTALPLPLPLLSRKPVCSNQLRKSCFAILYLLLFVLVNCADNAVSKETTAIKSKTRDVAGVERAEGASVLESATIYPQKDTTLFNNRFSIIADHHAMQKPPSKPTSTTSEKQHHQYQVQLPTRETIREPLKPIGEKRK